MSNENEYILVQDDSTHWYVIPADRENDWWSWVDSEESQLGVIPEYAEEVGGSPSLVKFKNYAIQ